MAAFTAAESVTAGPGVAARAEALGVAATSIDGNDAADLDTTAAGLIADVRSGAGPRLLHARTFRWTGHTSTDPAAWRDPAQVEAGKARCPIAKLRTILIESGIAEAELDAIHEAAILEMQAARARANQADWPTAQVAYEDVQDTGAAQWQK